MKMGNKFIIPDNVAISFFRETLGGTPTGRDHFARCPVCGDSETNKRKKRMYLLKEENWYVFCHNCGYSSGLSFFVKDYFPMQYDRMMASALGSFYGLDRVKTDDDVEVDCIIKNLQSKKNHLETFLKRDCIKLDNVDEILSLNKRDKKIVSEQIRYFKSRRISKETYSNFYYCNKITNEKQICYKNRIIIPFFKNNIPYFFQARVTNASQSPKYINWTNPGSNGDMKPEYNEHHVDKSKTVYIVEGLFDSLFIKNAVSTLGAKISDEKMRYFENKYPKRCFVMDNDEAGIEITTKLFNRGEKCFLMPPSDNKKQDINDMAIKLEVNDLTDFIAENSYSNLEGIFKMQEYNYITTKRGR